MPFKVKKRKKGQNMSDYFIGQNKTKWFSCEYKLIFIMFPFLVLQICYYKANRRKVSKCLKMSS